MRMLRISFIASAVLLGLAILAAGPALADEDVQPWSAFWEPLREVFNPFSGKTGPSGPRVAQADKPQGPPSLAADERAFDFGTVPASGVATHDFVIRNQGAGDLNIKNVSPG